MKNKYFKELAEMMAEIKDRKLVEDFLASILTPKEMEEIPKRLQIVKMLDKGIAQRKIAEKLGVSIGTITRGSREMQYGNEAFQKVLKMMA